MSYSRRGISKSMGKEIGHTISLEDKDNKDADAKKESRKLAKMRVALISPGHTLETVKA